MINLGISKFGSKWWRRWWRRQHDVQLHRLNGPAIQFIDGHIEYWVNNDLHRLDGPARIWATGQVEYWINGNQVTAYELMFINERCV